MSFQLRRGLDIDRLNIVFDEGELIYTRDTKKVFVGDGATSGGIDLLQSGHNHDSFYYRKGEVDTLLQNLGDSQEQLLDDHTTNLDIHRTINDSGNGSTDLWSAQQITQQLGTKAPSNHNHDSLYYRKTEINSLLSTINDSIDEGLTKVDIDDTAPGVLVDKIQSGQGVNVYKDVSGVDNLLRIGSDVYIGMINGQPKPVYVDSNKGGKVLSVETNNFFWAESRLSNNDWIQIGHATDADSGWIMPFDGTIVGVTAHCENNNTGNTKSIRLYKNGSVSSTSFINIPAGANAIVNNQTKNIDFVAGDRLRLRADSTGGSIEDTTISVFVKWRVA